MLKKILLTLLLATSLTDAIAASHFDLDCAEKGLKPKVEPKPNAERAAALDADGSALYRSYQELDPAIRGFLNEEELLVLAEETDAAIFRARMKDLVNELKGKDAARLEAEIENLAKAQLKKDHFSTTEITARVKQWKTGKKDRWFRLLGDRSLNEVRNLYVGKVAGEISESSLVGKYIKATGANARKIRVPIAPNSTELGPEKWIVPVSAASLEEFKKIAETDYFISVLGHAAILKNAEVVLHTNAYSAMRLPSAGTPLPMLLLKTSESERLNRYLSLIKSGKFYSWGNELKLPWKAPNYCEPGGFSCCTHWIGNMPIGDTLVSEYVLPGGEEYVTKNGQYVMENGWYLSKPKPPITAKLKPWVPANEQQKLLTSVWKVPGNMQLSEMIGQKAANGRGEFASPGWVIRTLMGPTSEERVPVIFYVVDDHKAAIPDSPQFNYERER